MMSISTLRAALSQLGRVLRALARNMRRWLQRVWARFEAWALRQGPAPMLSPALSYLTPDVRRRMARERARLATQIQKRR